jgi:hypothetical protein
MRLLWISLALVSGACTVVNLNEAIVAPRDFAAPPDLGGARFAADLAQGQAVDLAEQPSPPSDLGQQPLDLETVPVPDMAPPPPDNACDWAGNRCCVVLDQHYCAPATTGQLLYCEWPADVCRPCGYFAQPCCPSVPLSQQCQGALTCQQSAGKLLCLLASTQVRIDRERRPMNLVLVQSSG